MDYRKLLSRHRVPIMGVAALLIIFYHAEWQSAPFPLGLLSVEGQLGVDLFVFMSGFGLAHALRKRPSPQIYWRSRLRRLLPAYYAWFLLMLAVAAGMAVFLHAQADYLHWFLLHVFPLGVWMNRQPEAWYVSAALGYYALAPLFYFLLEHSRRPRAAAAVLVLLTGVLLPSVSGMDGVWIAVMRIPALAVGLTVGLAEERGVSSRSGLVCLAGLALAGVLAGLGGSLPLLRDLKASSLHRLTLNCIAPALAAFLAMGLEALERFRVTLPGRVLEAYGTLSLEIYLGQIVLNALIRDALHWPRPWVLLILLVTGLPAGMAMSWAGSRLLDLWDGALSSFRFRAQENGDSRDPARR